MRLCIALSDLHAAQVIAHGWPTWKEALGEAQACSQNLLHGTVDDKPDNHVLPGYCCSMATLVVSVHSGSFSA